MLGPQKSKRVLQEGVYSAPSVNKCRCRVPEKYKYIETNDYFIKVSIKDKSKNLLVYKPKYARIDDILKQIKLNLQEVEYNIIVLRDDLLLEKKKQT